MKRQRQQLHLPPQLASLRPGQQLMSPPTLAQPRQQRPQMAWATTDVHAPALAAVQPCPYPALSWQAALALETVGCSPKALALRRGQAKGVVLQAPQQQLSHQPHQLLVQTEAGKAATAVPLQAAVVRLVALAAALPLVLAAAAAGVPAGSAAAVAAAPARRRQTPPGWALVLCVSSQLEGQRLLTLDDGLPSLLPPPLPPLPLLHPPLYQLWPSASS